jgi:hypothetical protein
MRKKFDPPKIFFLFVIFLVFHGSSSGEEYEYKLKAEFIERFTRFIEWPPGSSVREPDIPFDICIAGTNPFGEYLTALARDVKIKNKPVRIVPIKKEQHLEACNVLFITAGEKPHLDEILGKVSETPVLTVGDTPGFAEKGVLINFYRSGNYVRFEINNGAAGRSGLRFSSRLLKLARLVDTSSLPQGSTK